jgi:hypothetical protein
LGGGCVGRANFPMGLSLRRARGKRQHELNNRALEPLLHEFSRPSATKRPTRLNILFPSPVNLEFVFVSFAAAACSWKVWLSTPFYQRCLRQTICLFRLIQHLVSMSVNERQRLQPSLSCPASRSRISRCCWKDDREDAASRKLSACEMMPFEANHPHNYYRTLRLLQDG